MSEHQYDLAVIGAGPGGYVAAIRAAQLGLRVACIDKSPSLGGTCLNIGCIPSKALLDSTELYDKIRHGSAEHGISVASVAMNLSTLMERKTQIVEQLTGGISQLFQKHKITSVVGTGKLLSPTEIEVTGSDATTRLTARNIVVATGSEPIGFPNAPFDEDCIVSSTGALSFPDVPSHLVVVGGGVIGMELGSVWLRLGSRVTVLELAPAILPGMDDEVVKTADRLFRKQGFEIRTGIRVAGIDRTDAGVRVALEGHDPLDADRVLVAVGRRPSSAGMGLEELGIKLGPRGFIEVDDRFHTGVGNVYAIGDVIRGAMLAHKAEEEGVAVAEIIAGHHGHVNYDAIPGVVYTFPEIASVGLTEQALKESGRAYTAGKFFFAANGRARAMGETDGFVKVLADAETTRLLGLHIIGPRASDLIAEAALAMEYSASAEDIGISVHAHPTLPEVLKEAALGALGRAIHR